MTATEVNGLKVVSDEPTPAPFKTPKGKTVLWTQTRTLTLEDGSAVYGCQHCDFTHASMHGVRPHLKVHQSRPEFVRVDKELMNTVFVDGMTLGDLVARLSELMEIEAERDRWYDRAVEAEYQLNRLRKALRSAGITGEA